MIGLLFASGASSSSSSPSSSHGNHATKWHLVTRLLGLPLREGARLSFVPGFYRKDREVVAPAARPYRCRRHAETTTKTSWTPGSLFASLISGDRHHEFSGK